MNTKTMLARENFIEVLIATVKKYYRQVHGAEVELTQHKRPGAVTLHLYMVPLFLSRFPLPKQAKELLYSEYNIRGNFLKYLIGKAGVFAITNSFGFGAAKKLYLTAPKGVNTSLFISPCNRTIRFYDFQTDTVDCILKDGYQGDFLNNQLDFRMTCHYPFVPKVLERGADWYRERIMHGHALARVRDTRLYERSLHTAVSFVSTLAEDTRDTVNAQAYICQLTEKLSALCADITGTAAEAQAALAKARNIEIPDLTVPTCISHGDLQTGNIWVSNSGEVILYDWETCARRSVWYDPVTLYCGLRSGSSEPLAVRLQTDDRWLCNDPNKHYSSQQIEAISRLVELEDLIFQLQEARQLTKPYQESRGAEVLAAYIAREASHGS